VEEDKTIAECINGSMSLSTSMSVSAHSAAEFLLTCWSSAMPRRCVCLPAQRDLDRRPTRRSKPSWRAVAAGKAA